MAQKTIGREAARAGLGKPRRATAASGDFAAAEDAAAKAPQAENPGMTECEKWLYGNPEALAAVKRGLADSAAGRGVKMSFLEFAEADADD